jgi:ABC-2 type transport system permease protein
MKTLKLTWATIKERKWSVIIYSIVSILLLLLYVSLFPSLQSQGQALNVVMKSLPPNLLKALGSSATEKFTLESLLASKQFSFVFQLYAAILAISIAGLDISSEIEKGTIEFLLSQPISRLKFYFARFLSGFILITIFVVASTLTIIPLAAAFHISYNLPVYYKLFFMAELFSLAIYSISYFFSSWFSAKSKVSICSAVIITIMYVAFLFSTLKENLDKLKYISFFHYFPPDLLTTNTIDKVGVWVFTITIIVFVTFGAIIFNKRDVAV